MPASLRIAAALGLAAASCAALAAPHYTAVDIGRWYYAKSINGNGDVLGSTSGLPEIYRSATGQWELIGHKVNYAPESLNNRDVVVGERNFGSRGRPHAVVFKSSGAIVDLLDARESYATVIHSDGIAYGAAQPKGEGDPFPFTWKSGHLTVLPPFPGYTWTMPVAVSKSGEIAANGRNDPRSEDCPMQPAIFRGGAWQALGSLGGTCGIATGMSDVGDVVGWSTYAGDKRGDAFLWHDGVMTDIVSLGGGGSFARDIDMFGQIVGQDIDKAGDAHAFVYDGGEMYWLDGLVDNRADGTLFIDAVSVNGLGQILAIATTGSSVDTFILTPVAQ